MKKRIMWALVSSLMVLSLVIASCAPKEEEKKAEEEKAVVTQKAEEKKVEEKEVVAAPTGEAHWWDKFGEPQYGGTIITRTASSPPHFDPFFGMAPTGLWLETLGMRDWAVDRKVWAHNVMYIPVEYEQGLLAESWEWPDLETVVFHIRKGVHWAINPYSQATPVLNGRELTAYDIEWSYNRYHGLGGFAGKGSPYRETPLKVVASVTATDKYTVVFKSAYPSIDMREILMESLPGTQIVAREVVEKWGDMNDWKRVASTGPFMLADYVPDSSINFIKNPNYYGYHEWYPENRLPYADKWVVLIIPDVATTMAALRTGKVDLVENLSWEQADNLARTNPELILSRLPSNGTTLDLRCDTPPFTDIRVRKALQMAIDLKTIAKTHYGGYVEPIPMGFTGAPGFMTPYDKWPQELKDGYAYNPEGAKKLLAEAGYPNGFKTNVVAQTTNDLDLLEIIKSYFADINVDMEIRVMDPAAFSSFVLAGKHDQMACNWNIGLMWPPAYTGLEYYSKHWRNLVKNNDPVFDKLFEKQMASLDLAERRQLLIEANDRVLAQYWSVRVLPTVTVNVNQPWLKGYSGEYNISQMYYVARFWIDQDIKKAMGR